MVLETPPCGETELGRELHLILTPHYLAKWGVKADCYRTCTVTSSQSICNYRAKSFMIHHLQSYHFIISAQGNEEHFYGTTAGVAQFQGLERNQDIGKKW